MELICPAGNLPALRAAIDNGADAVYIGFRNATNARNFPGLNFSPDEAIEGLHYAKESGKRVFLAVNIYATPESWKEAIDTVDTAAEIGVDALILADMGLMHYASHSHPDLRLHLSVQGSATNRHAIAFYHERFGIKRVVLPRVLSLAQVQNLVEKTAVEVEVFGYGSLCVMVEGRCALSSFVTGDSPNSAGVCSPAHTVRWVETPSGRESYLNGVLINRYKNKEMAGYPTLCKGRFQVTVRVSQINWCRFCVDINSAVLAKRADSMVKVEALERWRESELFDERERLVLEYTEAMTYSDQQVNDGLMHRLSAFFDEDGIVELTALIAFQNLSSKFNSALDVPAQGFCRLPSDAP